MTGFPAESDDVIIKLDGAPIGKAGCWRVPEIGFILHRSHPGQGLARKAPEAAIPRVFVRFPVPRIGADVDPRDAASLALLVRFGFRRAGAANREWKVGDEWRTAPMSLWIVRRPSRLPRVEQPSRRGGRCGSRR